MAMATSDRCASSRFATSSALFSKSGEVVLWPSDTAFLLDDDRGGDGIRHLDIASLAASLGRIDISWCQAGVAAAAAEVGTPRICRTDSTSATLCKTGCNPLPGAS